MSETEIRFLNDLEELSEGIEKPVVEDNSIITKLLEIYNSVQGKYNFFAEDNLRGKVHSVEWTLKKKLLNIAYSEQDIADVISAMQMKDFSDDESRAFGAYVGSLISILTRRNEEKGKKTFIEIPENRLNNVGYCCRKFDVVRFGVNSGDNIMFACNDGDELYVEQCDGNEFASGAGSYCGTVKRIHAGTVNGNSFASFAGAFNGRVDMICTGAINGNTFAEHAGSEKGCIGEISAETVNGDYFAYCAGNFDGKVGKIHAKIVNGDNFALESCPLE